MARTKPPRDWHPETPDLTDVYREGLDSLIVLLTRLIKVSSQGAGCLCCSAEGMAEYQRTITAATSAITILTGMEDKTPRAMKPLIQEAQRALKVTVKPALDCVPASFFGLRSASDLIAARTFAVLLTVSLAFSFLVGLTFRLWNCAITVCNR